MSSEILLNDPVISFFREKAKELNIKLFIVGGIPRDIIMGNFYFKDYDFVIFSDPLKIAKEFKKDFNSKIAYYSSFKTVEILFEDKSIDISMARKEFYPYPASLPEVFPVYDINEDLSRRDFTINSIAIEIFPEFGKTYDPFKGIEDIKNKKIRILKEGSFYEDPTRAFRAIRYKNRFDFNYTEETIFEFENYKNSVKNLKFPRIKKELEIISEEKERDKMWKEIAQRDLLYFFDENLKLREDKIKELSKILSFDKSSWICFFYLFFKDTPSIKSFLSFYERRVIDEIEKGKKLLEKEKDVFKLHHFFKKFDILSLKFLSLIREDINIYIERRGKIKKILSGEDIISLGIKRELVEKVKEIIETKQMEGVINTKEDAIKYIKENKDEIQGAAF
ncbi:MAG: hypothetical protein ABIM29_01410 [candidate division WOR-3 bacterium]